MPQQSRTFQVHANVNSDNGDNALRVTITFYDETGSALHHQTWRGHARALSLEGSDWTAYSAVVDLAKLLARACGSEELLPTDPDVPLF